MGKGMNPLTVSFQELMNAVTKEKVQIWFEQNIETGTMFSKAGNNFCLFNVHRFYWQFAGNGGSHKALDSLGVVLYNLT